MPTIELEFQKQQKELTFTPKLTPYSGNVTRLQVSDQRLSVNKNNITRDSQSKKLLGNTQMDFSLGNLQKSFGPAPIVEKKRSFEATVSRKRKPVSFFDPNRDRSIQYVESSPRSGE